MTQVNVERHAWRKVERGVQSELVLRSRPLEKHAAIEVRSRRIDVQIGVRVACGKTPGVERRPVRLQLNALSAARAHVLVHDGDDGLTTRSIDEWSAELE